MSESYSRDFDANGAPSEVPASSPQKSLGREMARLVLDEVRKLSIEDQLDFFAELAGGASGLDPRVHLEAIDAARVKAAEVAALERAEKRSLDEHLANRNRKTDPKTIRLAQEIDKLRVKGLSWSKLADHLWLHHRDWFPEYPYPLTEEYKQLLIDQCRKAHGRVFPKEKRS
jgi:hypothetical protein